HPADKPLGRTSTTGANGRIELEVPLESVVEVGRIGARPKTRSSFKNAIERLLPWRRGARAAAAKADTSGGIHESTAATNQWFDHEVTLLERDARKFAEEWATKGLPRHDVARTAPLEIEQFLAGRCAETFRQWVDRVRVQMRDRIAREAESIGKKLVD